MIYLYLFGTCFHFIYVFMIIGNNSNERIEITGKWKGTFYRNDKSLIRLEKME